MRTVAVRVEDGLLLDVKKRALDSGVSLSEVVRRLLRAYADGKVVVARREAE